MLRFDFLPSDFHPQFLILGERTDLACLAGELERLADDGGEGRVQDASGSELWLRSMPAPRGLRRAVDGHYQWEMSAENAGAFATGIRAVAEGEQPAGSAVLTVGRFDLEEIPVWISQGEFTDDYLINSF